MAGPEKKEVQKSQETLAPARQPNETELTVAMTEEKNGAKDLVSGALGTCDDFCMANIEKNPWTAKAEKILTEIQKDPALRIAFNTFLREYVGKLDNSNEFKPSENLRESFFGAMIFTGVPNTDIGINTAFNDILATAREGVRNTDAKWPYEKIKAIVEKVQNA